MPTALNRAAKSKEQEDPIFAAFCPATGFFVQGNLDLTLDWVIKASICREKAGWLLLLPVLDTLHPFKSTPTWRQLLHGRYNESKLGF